MRRFPAVRAWQAVVTRREHRDYLTLRLVVDDDADPAGLAHTLTQAAREAIKFRVDAVEFVADLPPDAPAIDDQRRWE